MFKKLKQDVDNILTVVIKIYNHLNQENGTDDPRSAQEFLNGKTMSADLHSLMGHCRYLGAKKDIFRFRRCQSLGEAFIKKWGNKSGPC